MITLQIISRRSKARDFEMSLSIDEFSEDFSDFAIASTIDNYSGYNQIPLDQ
jgi:hypothetical protein